METKKTIFYDEHVKHKGKMVPFAGWSLPVEYASHGLKVEHKATRSDVGLFDVSHMGEIRILGEGALVEIQNLLTQDFSKLKAGKAKYSLMLNDEGGVVDDLIVYCIEENKNYLLCVNASNIDKDLSWIQKNVTKCEVIHESDKWAQVAIQGPKAMEKLIAQFPELFELKRFSWYELKKYGSKVMVARTGYTGEDGVEIFMTHDVALEIWNQILPMGMLCGLGARNTLRIEAGYPLYGQELGEDMNPLEAGLGWTIKLDKPDFIGKASLIKKNKEFELIAITTDEKLIPREKYIILNKDKKEIGHVTSGTLSPTLDKPIAMALVKVSEVGLGGELWVRARGREMKFMRQALPFYKS